MITISNSLGSDGQKDDRGSSLRMRVAAAPAFIGQKIKDKKPALKSTGGKIKIAVGVGFTSHRKAKGQR